MTSIYDRYEGKINHNGVKYDLEIVDLNGDQVMTERLSCFMMKKFKRFDAFMICFAVNDRVSFENAQVYWKNEARKIDETAP